MMSKTFLVLLVICAILVADSEGWRRRRRRRRSRFWRKVGRVLGDIGKAVLKNGVKVNVPIGRKRDTDCGPDLTPEESNAIVEQLEEACPGLGLDASLGLDRAYIEAVFVNTDANNDGALQGDELDEFVTAIEALDACEDHELSKRK